MKKSASLYRKHEVPILVIIAIGIFVLAVCFVYFQNNIHLNETRETVEKTLVGGDQDTHGCIGTAGYVWCAYKNKCLRLFEEDCTP